MKIAVTGSDSSVEENVRSAIASTCQLELEDVGTEQSIDDLGLDSMGLTAVIARLEAAYDCEFGSDQVICLLQAATVGEFSAVVGNIVLRKASS